MKNLSQLEVSRRGLGVEATLFFIPDFSVGESFYGLIKDFVFYLPGYQPQTWATDFSEERNLSLIDLRSIARQEWSLLHWTRSASPSGTGSFSKRHVRLSGPEHLSHRLLLSVKNNEQMEWFIGYMQYCAASDGVDFAFCDAAGSRQGVRGDDNLTSLGGCSTATLRTALPDLSWGQIFGKAYVELFGLERMLSCPAYRVEQLTPDSVYVQLTKSVFDTFDNAAHVHAIKQLVKRHLDDNIFYDPNRPKGHVYRTPQFDL